MSAIAEGLFLLLAVIPAYLLGAFPTGIILAQHAGIDLQQQGSGNVGATNVARVLGKKAGVLTLTIDVLKGVIAVLLARWIFGTGEGLGNTFVALSAFAVVCGHCFSIPGKLRGGKGVATALGVLLSLSPLLALCSVLVFAAVLAYSRIVSIASVSAALTLPILGSVVGPSGALFYSIGAIGLLVTIRHHENISRFIRGKEKKFSFASKEG